MEHDFLDADVFAQKRPVVFLPYFHSAFALALAAFFVPFLFHSAQFQTQLIVGTLVNFLLALSAFCLAFRHSLPVILLPSLAVLASGLVFGGFTIYLSYLVPFIWIGNALYVYAIKHYSFGSGRHVIGVAAASALKAAFLFAATSVLVFFGTVPAIFLGAMGLVQLATALAGGLLAIPALRFLEK